MLVPFESLPDHSRIWIYQSNRKFNSQERVILSDTLTAFTSMWSAHGVPLQASFQVRFDQLIILAVDENQYAASGCSIDDSARTIKTLGQTLGIDLFDRTSVAFQKQDDIITIPRNDLKKKFQEGIWNHQTLVVNTLVATKGELQKGLLLPAELTWLKRYLPRETVAG